MKYLLSILGLALVIIFVTGYLGIQNTKMTTSADTTTPTTTTPDPTTPGQDTTPETTSSSITEADLATHNSQSDCWVSYQGRIYDITAFLPKHKGSAGAISPYCGTATEFEKAFVRQHGTSKVAMLMRMGVHMGDFTPLGTLQ